MVVCEKFLIVVWAGNSDWSFTEQNNAKPLKDFKDFIFWTSDRVYELRIVLKARISIESLNRLIVLIFYVNIFGNDIKNNMEIINSHSPRRNVKIVWLLLTSGSDFYESCLWEFFFRGLNRKFWPK